jgi:hypothetical protein
LKAETKDKLQVVNVEVPKLWEHRKQLRERVLHYSRKSIDLRDSMQETKRDTMREIIRDKTHKLAEHIKSERVSRDRERNIKEERAILERAKQRAKLQ